MLIIGLKVYPLVYAGVTSKSKYSYLGGLRSSVARVRYEVVVVMVILNLIVSNKTFIITGVRNLGLLPLFLV